MARFRSRSGERFRSLPIVVHERDGGLAMLILQLAALVICGLVIVVGPDRIDDSELAVTAAVVVALVVLFEVARRFRRTASAEGITVDATGVRRAAKDASWHEPLTAYEGVVWREELRSAGLTGSGPRKRRISFVELRHREDPERTVKLVERGGAFGWGGGRRGVRAAWKDVARALDLPILRELPDGSVLRREAGELDRSLAALARAGQLEVPEDARYLPQGVTLLPGDPPEGRIQRASPFAFYLFLASIGVALIAVAAVAMGGSPLPLLAASAPLLGYLCWSESYLQIGLDNGILTLAEKVGPVALRSRRLVADEIEEIWHEPYGAGGRALQSAPPPDMRRVRAESDRAAVELGPLPTATAAWLVAFLTELAVRGGSR